MRHFLLLLFLLGVAQAHADSTATNATELRDALRGTAQPAELRELGHDNGCGPNGCLVDIEPLRIWLEQGRMEQLDGTPLRLRELGSNLPELDLSPLGAYRVSTGACAWNSATAASAKAACTNAGAAWCWCRLKTPNRG